MKTRERMASMVLTMALSVSSLAYGYFAGDGRDVARGNDCLIGYGGVDAGQVTLDGKIHTVTCTDCDPTCDHDGDSIANGSCTFHLGVCINQIGVEKCSPPSVLDKASAKAKVNGVKVSPNDLRIVAPPLQGSICWPSADATVPIKGKHGTGSLTLKLSALVKKNPSAGITKARTDKDKLTYACVPRPAGEPCPSSTTSTSTSTTVETTTTTTTLPPCIFATKWGTQGTGDGEFDSPGGIAVDRSGDVYVADTENHRIQKFTNTGDFLTKWGTHGSGDGQFSSPYGIAVEAGGDVYVGDTSNHRVQKFTSTGGFVTKWGSYGGSDGQFRSTVGVGIDATGFVYVTDGYNSRIQKFTNTGAFIVKWGSAGAGDGEFNIATGIAVDGEGNQFVSDLANSRVQKFTGAGEFLTKWGSLGSASGQFDAPVGVSIGGAGNVYVADRGNRRIQKFTNTGTFLMAWGSFGSGDGQFNDPHGVAVDMSEAVFVADTGNNRIQKFVCPTLDSTTSTSLPSTTSTTMVSTTSTSLPSTTSTTVMSTTSTSTDTSSTTSTTLCVSTSGTFCDLGDGTVYDAATGLQWEKKTSSVGSGVNAADLHDVDNRYSWAGVCSGMTSKYCQPTPAAAAACKAQTEAAHWGAGCEQCVGAEGTCNVDPNSEGTITTAWNWVDQLKTANYAGHNDWRLPSESGCNSCYAGATYRCTSCVAHELETILPLPYPCGSPCINPIGPTAANLYWSASTYATTPTLAWGVFYDGFVLAGGKPGPAPVRAVRDNP